MKCLMGHDACMPASQQNPLEAARARSFTLALMFSASVLHLQSGCHIPKLSCSFPLCYSRLLFRGALSILRMDLSLPCPQRKVFYGYLLFTLRFLRPNFIGEVIV